jgi:hypothetical protein
MHKRNRKRIVAAEKEKPGNLVADALEQLHFINLPARFSAGKGPKAAEAHRTLKVNGSQVEFIRNRC